LRDRDRGLLTSAEAPASIGSSAWRRFDRRDQSAVDRNRSVRLRGPVGPMTCATGMVRSSRPSRAIEGRTRVDLAGRKEWSKNVGSSGHARQSKMQLSLSSPM